MNVLYSCCIVDPWLDVAKELKQHGMNPSYWIGWNKDNRGSIQKELPEVVWHDIDLAWKGLFPEEIEELDRPQLDGFELETHTYEELMALKMLDRLDPDQSSFTFNERQQFFRTLLRRWLNVLQGREIDLVISPSIPHRVFDYAIYVATRILNIDFLTFKMTPWPGYLIPVQSITGIPTPPEPDGNSDCEIKEAVSSYVAKVKADYEQAEPDYMKKQQSEAEVGLMKRIGRFFVKKNTEVLTTLFEPSTAYWKKKGETIHESVYTNFEKLVQKYHGIRFKLELKEKYEAMCTEPDFDRDYLFVALHYQPEETSCPSGNIFVDQSLMIEALLKAFPDHVQLYVKEHPSQFNPKMEGQAGRNAQFYQTVNAHPRVRLISGDIDSFKLIDHTRAVVTLTGTVGIEGVIRNKPAIVFGNAWYENLPGVFKIDSREALMKLPGQELNGMEFSEQALVQGLNRLYKNCLQAFHYKGVEDKSLVAHEKSVNNLVRYISTTF